MRFFIEEKLRVGIKHVADLKHEEVANLMKDKSLHGDITEKSDGMAFAFGKDEHGFYTRTSHSDKMREPEDYEAAARQKFGDDFDPTISQHFGRIHRALQNNKALMDHLHGSHGDTMMKGEIFYRPNGMPAKEHPDHVRFVGTAYDTNKMGNLGSFVLHSKLPENAKHDLSAVKGLGDHNFTFDHDAVSGGSNARVDVSDLQKEFKQIKPDILSSRKATDKEAKAAEQEKFNAFKQKLDQRMRGHTHLLDNKWGAETEGHIFHPKDPSQPRIKLISDTFKKNKAEFSFKK